LAGERLSDCYRAPVEAGQSAGAISDVTHLSYAGRDVITDRLHPELDGLLAAADGIDLRMPYQPDPVTRANARPRSQRTVQTAG
jgi:hypothetical protein